MFSRAAHAMDLTVIIVNWNTQALLRNCLESIRQHGGALAIETIVVDNNSADGSRAMVAEHFPDVILVNSGGNLGFARANNLAVPRASAPYILFLNPDTEIRPGALASMVEFMRKDPGVGALGCKIRDVSGQLQELGLQWFPSPLTELLKYCAVSTSTYRRLPRFFPYHDPESSGFVRKLFGACLLVPRKVLDQVGSFDDRFFMYCEDVDLCHRIGSAGWRLYYLSEVEILHLGAGASDAAPGAFAVLMNCESFSKLMRKYYGALGAVAYRLIVFAGAQLRLALLLLVRFAAFLRRSAPAKSWSGSVKKHLTTLRWTLGLERAVIRG